MNFEKNEKIEKNHFIAPPFAKKWKKREIYRLTGRLNMVEC